MSRYMFTFHPLGDLFVYLIAFSDSVGSVQPRCICWTYIFTTVYRPYSVM